MDVFVAFDPADADRVGTFTAALNEAGAGVTFTFWLAEEPGNHRDPPGTHPRFYDTQGRALITDRRQIKRALGVLALITSP